MESPEKQNVADEVRKRARNNFSKGFNCSECVVEAVLGQIDVGLPDNVLKMATGFGGGIGLFGDTCGALVGAIMCVSAVHGRSKLPEGENALAEAKEALYGKPGLYRVFNQIPNMVEKKYGTTLCREITAEWQNDWLCREHALYCREIITEMAGCAAEFINGDPETLGLKPFGKNVENLKETG